MDWKNQQRLAIFILVSVVSSSVLSDIISNKPSPETPDPLEQFLENQYIKDKLSVFVETQHYSWENKADSTERGAQSIMPVTLTYRHNNLDLGLRRAYITSENKTTGANGKVSTWSDTALTAAYTFKSLDWPVRLSLDYNMPNGKATLNRNEKNAIMDSFLVQQTQFGEGENITPGISITKAVDSKNIFGVGLSYSKKGVYDPNSNVQNDVIDPGNEAIVTAQWQHNEASWMVIGGLIATRYGVTQRSGVDYYQKGSKYDLNLTTLNALPWDLTQGQQLMFNFRYIMQRKDSNIDPSANVLKKEAQDSNPDTFYLSLDWSKSWSRRHTLHLLLDYLKAKDNGYAKTDTNYDAGKSKRSLGLGYDYAISDRSTVSFRAKRFSVSDKAEQAGFSDTEYWGDNLTLNFNYQF